MIRWFYPAVGLAANVILGTIYSWSVFRKPLENMCGWSDFESSLPFSVFLLFFALTVPVGGRMMNRFGPRKTALVGAVLVGLGWSLSGVAVNLPNSLPIVLLTYGVVAGAGVGIFYGVPITVSSRWIPEKRGFAMGLTLLGFGLSPLITAPLASTFLSQYGVQATLTTFGITFGIILALLSTLLKFPPVSLTVTSSSAQTAKSKDFTTREMMRTGMFRTLWFLYFVGTFGGFIAISLSAKYCVEVVGLTPQLAAAFTGVFAIFNGTGRPLFGYLTDRMGIQKTATYSFIILTAAAVLANFSQSLPVFAVSFSIFWLIFGGWLAIAPSATSKFFGLKNLGTNYGVVFTAYGFSALIGPPASSALREITGTYTIPFTMIAVLALLGLAFSVTKLKTGEAHMTLERETTR
ncbi:MAG: OFA family MFS transporter [Candidatus Caldarchaeum sp.]|nr:OFA family MFS transporter [Candidatus Caldarchaeum sp.]MDW8063080.1 OFA family MFS transporter [Candidatus Caldarchaeum sp.]